MRFLPALTVLSGSAVLVAAVPPAKREVDPSLRLIKTSPTDAGTWVSEDEKYEKYISKNINYIDITDIKDPEVLAQLSVPAEENAAIAQRAVTYPTTLSHQTEANALVAKVSTTNPQSWLKTFSDFQNRHYRSSFGTQSSTWLFNLCKSITSADSSITVTQFTHSFNQPSVIVKIPGSASTNLVIVGSHQDSIAGGTSARAPGAEDDGSGVVVLLEALRVLVGAGFKPKDTLEFHFYAGEEGGLLGSADVFANYKRTGKTVLAMLHQDMAGYSPSGKITTYTDYVDSSLTSFVRLIVSTYVGQTALSSRCGYGCSDHASATSNGFPAAYAGDEPFDTSANFIHTANDSYDKIMWPTILRHAKMVVGFLVEASYL